MCVCVLVHAWVDTYTCMCICVYEHTCVHTYVCVYFHVWVYAMLYLTPLKSIPANYIFNLYRVVNNQLVDVVILCIMPVVTMFFLFLMSVCT